MKLTVIVATHKAYRMPLDDIYMPVHAGRNNIMPEDAVLSSFTGDDTGENISKKNKNYCELTALYWAWKNLDYDYLGLAHYRRHFRGVKSQDKWRSVLTKDRAEKLLLQYDVILPVKRDYFIETTYSQYIHAHNKQDLDKTLEIITEKYPKYLDAWDKVMDSTKGHRFNMFIMKKEILDSYCNWLFDILFTLEQRLDITGYSANDRRVFGFVSERLLDVWLMTNNIRYTELPVVNMESQNWPKKILNFLKRKFIVKK